ncbi:hypothetical protein CNEO4_300014 [Clostridium neonatale]|nr:hypothetical protein CNEO3_10015 [Clostridium neonatale]CAI3578199.1 hypothetical protein CNEO4_2130027 [Clostridium neonatale]CAI3606662.1 hypothetical protein CNEO4_300014 [Clostridium neonatale]
MITHAIMNYTERSLTSYTMTLFISIIFLIKLQSILDRLINNLLQELTTIRFPYIFI